MMVISFGKCPMNKEIPLTNAYAPASDVLAIVTITKRKHDRIPQNSPHATSTIQKTACDFAYRMKALFIMKPITAPPSHDRKNAPTFLNLARQYPTQSPMTKEIPRMTQPTHIAVFFERKNW